MEQFVSISCFGTICPGKLFWNNLSQGAFCAVLEQFISGSCFKIIFTLSLLFACFVELSRLCPYYFREVLNCSYYVPIIFVTCWVVPTMSLLFFRFGELDQCWQTNLASQEAVLEQCVPGSCFATICAEEAVLEHLVPGRCCRGAPLYVFCWRGAALHAFSKKTNNK